MSTLTRSHNRLSHEFSEHPVRSSVTVGGLIVLTLAAIGVLSLLPEIMRYIRMRRM